MCEFPEDVTDVSKQLGIARDYTDVQFWFQLMHHNFTLLNGLWWSKDVTKNRKNVIYNSMVKSVLMYGVETWGLCEGDRRGIDGTEMDVLRRSSKLDRKRNEHI